MINAPITVSASEIHGPEIITRSDVKGAIREALYEPFAKFENLANIMHSISQRNGTLLASMKLEQQPSPGVTPDCRPYSKKCFPPPLDYAEEVVGAISCSDGPDQINMTAEQFVAY